jgi:hypothetical protein
MLAGVGSHTNHPVRVPLDTPVIFNSVLDA